MEVIKRSYHEHDKSVDNVLAMLSCLPYFLFQALYHKCSDVFTLGVEARKIGSRIETTRPDRPFESREQLSQELNLRLPQVIYSLINILQVQISRAINSAINLGEIPEIQNIMGSMSFGQRDTDSGTPKNSQAISEKTKGVNIKLTKKDSRSAFDFRDTGDLTPQMVTGATDTQQPIPDFLSGPTRCQQNLQGHASAQNTSLDTRQHTQETAMPETSQCAHCKANYSAWQKCPKLKKTQTMGAETAKSPSVSHSLNVQLAVK